MLRGVAVSAGISIGKAVVIRPAKINVVKRTVNYLDEEKKRFLDAVEVFVSELERVSETVEQNVGPSEAAILNAQIAIVRDPELTKEVLRTIERQRVNAEYAFHMICNGYITLFSHLEDETLSARSADFQDIRDRMLRILMGVNKADLAAIPRDSILVADDIPPSQAAGIASDRVVGFLTRKGTRFSHIAIIARSLGLPAVVAVENLFDAVKGGETLIIDGDNGTIWVDPDEAMLEECNRQVQGGKIRRQELEKYRDSPTCTLDGKAIRLAANFAVEQELDVIRTAGADGIGLYRTEFLFMERGVSPSEQEQFEAYKKAVMALGGKPVIIRTLDIGGDKGIPYLFRETESNPFLGYRAIRYCLDRPDFFKTQLAAILRAAVYGNVHILLPMISCITELRAARSMIAQTVEELAGRGETFRQDVPLGIMIETPAAVLCASELARECDFFSIGTNDLIQYLLAVDRGNDNVAALYNPLHPAVLRTIAMTVQAAHAVGIPVGVCGESASDPLVIPFLIGVGVDELSVSSGALLSVRGFINGLFHCEWQRYASDILSFCTADEVKQFLSDKLPWSE